MVPQELDQFTGRIYRLPCCAFRTSPARRALRPLKSTPTFQASRENQSLESFGSRSPRNSRISNITLLPWVPRESRWALNSFSSCWTIAWDAIISLFSSLSRGPQWAWASRNSRFPLSSPKSRSSDTPSGSYWPGRTLRSLIPLTSLVSFPATIST